MTELVIAFIGLVATLVGSAAAFYAGRIKERRDAQREEYSRFISVMADLAFRDPNSPEDLELTKDFNEQKAKIILYCGPGVFDALVAYSKCPPTEIEALNLNYCKVIAAMRADMGGKRIPDFLRGVKTVMIEAHLPEPKTESQ